MSDQPSLFTDPSNATKRSGDPVHAAEDGAAESVDVYDPNAEIPHLADTVRERGGPSPFTEGLNPDQLDAVVHADGPLLVVAGAGSGKTRVLTHRIAHLIDTGARPSEILA